MFQAFLSSGRSTGPFFADSVADNQLLRRPGYTRGEPALMIRPNSVDDYTFGDRNGAEFAGHHLSGDTFAVYVASRFGNSSSGGSAAAGLGSSSGTPIPPPDMGGGGEGL